MSTKSTVFLTRDNEHCYTDCMDGRYTDDKWIGDSMTLEIDGENIEEIRDDGFGGTIITIRAGTHIWKILKELGKIDEDAL